MSQNTSPRFGRWKIPASSAASIAEDKRRSESGQRIFALHDAIIEAKRSGDQEALANAKAALQAARDAG